MSYATPADLLARHDCRLIGDLAGDTNVRIDATTLLTNTNVLTALIDASGTIESACFVGQRYSSTDLSALPTNSAGLLKRLTCDLAFAYLFQRRGYNYMDKMPALKYSFDLLDRLRLGERVFDVGEVEAKGNPTSDVVSLGNILLQNKISMQTHFFPLFEPIPGM